jgi:hypothetical protein
MKTENVAETTTQGHPWVFNERQQTKFGKTVDSDLSKI